MDHCFPRDSCHLGSPALLMGARNPARLSSREVRIRVPFLPVVCYVLVGEPSPQKKVGKSWHYWGT